MSVKFLIEDALTLYGDQRFFSAFCLALIAVEATAYKRYGHLHSPSYIQSSAARFKTFLKDETQTHTMGRIRHAVDSPPQPNVGQPPAFTPPGNDDENLDEFQKAFEEYKQDLDRWYAKSKEAFEAYEHKFKDAGDDFRAHLGQPRLVSTTGILYQSRCEIVHEGRLAAIRIAPAADDRSLSVSGIDPIEFSSSWIKFILGIVAAATENRGLFNK